MEKEYANYIHQLKLKPGASARALVELERSLGIRFPDQYAEFMSMSNGAEGSMGAAAYLVLWPLEDIASLNAAYAVDEFAPGLVLFGSDGADTGYAFDTRKDHLPIVAMPFVGMSLNAAAVCGETFAEFLRYLSAT